MEIVTTQRLVLRPFYETDLVGLYEYARDPEVGPQAGWKAHETLEESRAVLAEFIKSDEVWAIVYKDTNQLVGSIGLHPDKKRARPDVRMLGYVLASPFWGKGLMTEAALAALHAGFMRYNLALISVYHYPHNQRSRRVVEKCGFVYEGILRGASLLPDGAVTDEVCYALKREEYLARQ